MVRILLGADGLGVDYGHEQLSSWFPAGFCHDLTCPAITIISMH